MPPTFCRHNRFVHNCPICKAPEPPAAPRAARAPRARGSSGGGARTRSAMRVRHVVQAADDGYRSALVPGLRSTADAERLADELAFAAARLAELATDPPGIYAEIGSATDLEEATWLAFLTAYLTPMEGEEPFAGLEAARVPWAGGEVPDLSVSAGPRSSHDDAHGERTVLAYRAWAQRAGAQQAAIEGEAAWTAERRFDRIFERLTLPGFGRAARYELLVTLGRLGVYDLRPSALHLTDDATTLAAKRVFGIGDVLLLERRAAELAEAVELPVEALDLGLFNWGQGTAERATFGSRESADEDERDAIAGVLGT